MERPPERDATKLTTIDTMDHLMTEITFYKARSTKQGQDHGKAAHATEVETTCPQCHKPCYGWAHAHGCQNYHTHVHCDSCGCMSLSYRNK